ncbi:MAG: dienelactone hydrolase family protein [Candidatus Abyssubacteria bacterium]
MKHLLITCIVLLYPICAWAELRTQVVEYRHGDAVLEGYLAYDDSFDGPRAGVLVFHEWMGLGDYEKGRTEQLAKLGYVAFAADIYGKGIRPTTREEAAKQAGIYRKDRQLMRARAKAALDVLRNHTLSDDSRIAAIGYCFGGGVALELARSGADVVGAVTFHGSLNTPNPADARNIKGKILVLHGADDPHVSGGEVAAFQDEMRAAGVDWLMVSYGDAVHSFTNPAAGADVSTGSAYNEKADRRSWEAMKTFFGEVFK